MNIDKEFETFIEFPEDSDKRFVTTVSTKLFAKHCMEKHKQRIEELEEELRYWITQKGCECGHPACSNCRDTKDAKALLDT